MTAEGIQKTAESHSWFSYQLSKLAQQEMKYVLKDTTYHLVQELNLRSYNNKPTT